MLFNIVDLNNLSKNKVLAALGLILIASLILLSIPTARASDYSSDLSLSMSSAKLCPGSTVQILGTLQNNGARGDTYTLSTDSSGVTVAPSKVYLDAGKSEAIYVYITPSYTAQAGTRTVKISAAGSSSDSASFSLEILSCYGIKITPQQTSQEACAGDTASFDISIQNLGKNADTFALTATSGTLSQTEVSIAANETKSVKLSAKAEKNENITIQAQSKTSPAVETATVELKTKNCYGGAVSSDTEAKESCLGESENFTFALQNTGSVANVYNMSATKGTLSKSQLTLGVNQSDNFNLALSSNELGESSSTISITGSGVQLTKTIKLTAKSCEGVAVILTPQTMTACSDAKAQFEVLVKNTGKKTDTFTLNSTIGSLKNSPLEIGTGAVKSSILDISTVNLSSQNNFVVSAVSSKKTVSDSMSGNLAVETCYGVEMSADRTADTFCTGSTLEFSLTIKNNGKEPDVFNITSSFGELDKNSVSLKSNESAVVKLEVSDGGDVLVIAKSTNSAALASVNLSIGAKADETCHGFSLSADKTIVRAITNDTKGYLFNLTVENTGEIAASYAVKLTAADWMSLDPKAFKLSADKTKQVFVYAAPPYGTADGVYTATVEVSNDWGIEKEQKLVVAVGSVSDAEIEKVLATTAPKESSAASNTTQVTLPSTLSTNVTAKGSSLTEQLANLRLRWKVAIAALAIIVVGATALYARKIRSKKSAEKEEEEKGKKKKKSKKSEKQEEE